jgi:hypothetical protein
VCNTLGIVFKLAGLILLILLGIYLVVGGRFFLSVLLTIIFFLVVALLPLYITILGPALEKRDIENVSSSQNIQECYNVYNSVLMFMVSPVMFVSLFYLILYIFAKDLRGIKLLYIYFLNLILLVAYLIYNYGNFRNMIENNLQLYDQYYN